MNTLQESLFERPIDIINRGVSDEEIKMSFFEIFEENTFIEYDYIDDYVQCKINFLGSNEGFVSGYYSTKHFKEKMFISLVFVYLGSIINNMDLNSSKLELLRYIFAEILSMTKENFSEFPDMFEGGVNE